MDAVAENMVKLLVNIKVKKLRCTPGQSIIWAEA